MREGFEVWKVFMLVSFCTIVPNIQSLEWGQTRVTCYLNKLYEPFSRHTSWSVLWYKIGSCKIPRCTVSMMINTVA